MTVASWLALAVSSQFSIRTSLSASNACGNTNKTFIIAVFSVSYCAGCVAVTQLWIDLLRYANGVICASFDWGLAYTFMPDLGTLPVWDQEARPS